VSGVACVRRATRMMPTWMLHEVWGQVESSSADESCMCIEVSDMHAWEGKQSPAVCKGPLRLPGGTRWRGAFQCALEGIIRGALGEHHNDAQHLYDCMCMS
jgi:hypothetical protein